MAKTSTPMKMVNIENTLVIPMVNVPAVDVALNPMRLAKSRRNSVDATLSVKVVTVKPV